MYVYGAEGINVCLFRKPKQLPDSLPFDGTTTAHDDFDRKQIPERESFVPKRVVTADIKFDGESTYNVVHDKKEIPERPVRYGSSSV